MIASHTSPVTCIELWRKTAREWRLTILGLVAAALCWAAPGAGHAAEPVYLILKANGVIIQGDSSVISLGRENNIECLSFDQSVVQPYDAVAGRPSGYRIFQPIRITKRIDKSSPLLAKALANGETIEGLFRFFRPNPSGDGTTEHFYSIEIARGLITKVRPISENALDPVVSINPAFEEVEIAYTDITYVYHPAGVEFRDRFDPPAAAGSPSGFIVNGQQAAQAVTVAPPKPAAPAAPANTEEKPAADSKK